MLMAAVLAWGSFATAEPGRTLLAGDTTFEVVATLDGVAETLRVRISAFHEIEFGSESYGPATLELGIVIDGDRRLATTLTPNYTVERQEDRDCGICESAVIEVHLD